MAMKNVKKVVALLMAASVMSIGSVSFAADFSENFEGYSAVTSSDFVPYYRYVNQGDGNNKLQIGILNNTTGNASITRFMIKDSSKSIFDSTYEAKSEDGIWYAKDTSTTNTGLRYDKVGDYKYNYINNTKTQKAETGEWEGANTLYGGLNNGLFAFNYTSSDPAYTGEEAYGMGAFTLSNPYYDQLVVERDGDKELVLHPWYPNWNSVSDLPRASLFGNEDIDIVGRKTTIKAKVYIDSETTSKDGDGSSYGAGNRNSAFRISLLNYKDDNTYRAKYLSGIYGGNRENMNHLIQFRPSAGWFDTVTFMGGNVYLGNVGSTWSALNNANVVCTYNTKTEYAIEYTINATDIANPTHSVVIKDAEGTVLATKSAPITPADLKTTLGDNTFDSIYKDSCSPMTKGGNQTFEFSDGARYGVMFSNDVINTKRQQGSKLYLDDIAVEAFTGPTTIAGTISGNAVSATVTPGSAAATSAKLFAAEFDAETGRCLQIAPAQDVTYLANGAAQTPTVTFSNALTAGSKVKLYLWDSFTNIDPLASAVTVR